MGEGIILDYGFTLKIRENRVSHSNSEKRFWCWKHSEFH